MVTSYFSWSLTASLLSMFFIDKPGEIVSFSQCFDCSLTMLRLWNLKTMMTANVMRAGVIIDYKRCKLIFELSSLIFWTCCLPSDSIKQHFNKFYYVY